MLTVDQYGQIRRAHRDGMSIREIVRRSLRAGLARILSLSTLKSPPSRGFDPECWGSQANQQANRLSQLAFLG